MQRNCARAAAIEDLQRIWGGRTQCLTSMRRSL
jgi:hypothetical protein